MPRRIELSAHQIVSTLVACDGNRSAAARRLGIASATLRQRLEADPSILATVVANRAYRSSWLAERLDDELAISKHVAKAREWYAGFRRTAHPRRLSEEEIDRFLRSTYRLRLRV